VVLVFGRPARVFPLARKMPMGLFLVQIIDRRQFRFVLLSDEAVPVMHPGLDWMTDIAY
jgi:hypothetical protein